MKKISFGFSSLLLLVCFSTLQAAPPSVKIDFKKLDELIGVLEKLAHVGIQIQDFDSGKILFEKNAQKYFTPASILKVATVAGALTLLGPNFRYETEILIEKNGTLYVVFRGDPSFKSQNLIELLKTLPIQKLKHFNGRIVIENAYFEKPDRPMGWAWNSNAWYYQAPINHIMLDQNRLEVQFKPNSTLGKRLDIAFVQPQTHPYTLASNVKTVSVEAAKTTCQLIINQSDNHFQFEGCWPVGSDTGQFKIANEYPEILVTHLLKKHWPEQLKSIEKIVFKTLPEKTTLTQVAVHHSPALSELIKDILQESNNILTESLLKTCAISDKVKSGSFARGLLHLKQALSKLTGLSLEALPLFDGSGASRYNLITPAILNRILYTVGHDPNLAPLFQQALSLSGQNGTLKNRLTAFDTQEKFLGKTGTLNGISGLCGFVRASGGQTLVLTLVTNHAPYSMKMLKNIEDQLILLLV